MLEVSNLVSRYGHVTALKGVSLKVAPGEFVAILGSNGAGKTTLLRTVAGLHAQQSGQLRFEGEDIGRLPSHERIKRGICLVPEGRHVFPRMTVYENLLMGGFLRSGAETKRKMEMVFDLFPVLKERKQQKAGTLSGGEAQMVALGRGIMGEPKLLLLDEPSLGLAPMVIETIFNAIGSLNKQEGTTIALVEQNANMALRFSSRAYVLETGSVAIEGQSAQLEKSEYVRRSYLGM